MNEMYHFIVLLIIEISIKKTRHLPYSVVQKLDSRFNISLVTATSTRIQSEDVLHGAHVIDEM
jgi:uncharacterized protein YlxP (DUF503 family)